MLAKKGLMLIGIIWLALMLAVPAFASQQDLDQIRAAIAAKHLNWTADENKLTEQGREHWSQLLGMPQISQDYEAENLPETRLPSSWDWRDQNIVTSIKDQQNCGSCWAHAMIGALESLAVKDGGYPKSLNLSEQYLVSDCFPTYDCNGAEEMLIVANFLKSSGAPDEACYPYEARNTPCQPCSDVNQRKYKISNAGHVAESVSQLKQACYDYGPIAGAMLVYTDFMYYSGGVYSYAWGQLEGGHAMLIVGWNDSSQYFIVKNSFGSWWGESGYFRIAYSQVSNDVEFGTDSIWMTWGSGPGGSSDKPPILDNLGYYLKSGSKYNPLTPPIKITTDQVKNFVIGFDYDDPECNLNEGHMDVLVNGKNEELGPLTDMTCPGTTGFYFTSLDADSYSGKVSLTDANDKESNKLNFSFQVTTPTTTPTTTTTVPSDDDGGGDDESGDDASGDDASGDDTSGGASQSSSDDDNSGNHKNGCGV